MATNTSCPRFCKNRLWLVELGRDVTADDVVLKEDYASSCRNARLMCVNAPESVTVADATRVVIKYLEANTTRLHEKFDWLALEALQDAWPCH
jgi:Rap1a immunity proteins